VMGVYDPIAFFELEFFFLHQRAFR
jgi:hypothetical protein